MSVLSPIIHKKKYKILRLTWRSKNKRMRVKRGYYDVFVGTCAKSPSRIAVRHFDNGEYKNYTYSELYGVCEYISQNLQQLKCNKGVIGLVSKGNILIPCVIAAAHKCCTTFMFLDPSQDLGNIINDIQFKVIITIGDKESSITSELFSKKPEKTVSVFDLIISFYSLDNASQQNSNYVPEHSFIAMTSGSTGDPKHIQVPVQCIQPNVDDLTKMFNITSDDIIYFSTPLTFDPSMIEILLACMNGASLLIAPEKANILFPENKQNSITFWQTTPSKFLQYSNVEIKNRILSANSTLKILALGGEPLSGIKRLKELKDKDNKTKIYTLYGVTEMSCWACVTELDLEKIPTDREVPLGQCLSETQLIVEPTKDNNSGKIILVSKTRKCVILNKSVGNEEENSLKFIDTGDIGEVRNGNVYYRGRKDDIIKRFGHKVNLQFIESSVMLCPKVKTCSCVWLPKPMILLVYYSSETLSSQELSDFLKCKLDDKHWPDKIIRVDSLPTNAHGKISKYLLSKFFEKSQNKSHVPTLDSLKVLFLKTLKTSLNKHFIYDEIKDKNFFLIGGTSFQAVSFCNHLSMEVPHFGKLILPYLMSQKKSIDEIMQIVQREICEGNTKPKLRMKRSVSTIESYGYSSTKRPSLGSNCGIEMILLWTCDTGKCVDASPTLLPTGINLYVTVGSHSGKVIVVDTITGTLQGMLNVGSRIEAAVLCYYQDPVTSSIPYGVVGTYDGTVTCFAIESCREIWRINVGHMIKSKAVWCNGRLYIASYDGNIRCIDATTGEIRDVVHIAEHAISADLVLAKNEFVLTGTLSGVCAAVHVRSHSVSWRGALASPVFASPALYDDHKYVVFLQVNGEVHCRTVEKGIKIWKYEGAKGNIFSSVYIKEIGKLSWQIIFGCHDNNVYCIHVRNFQPSLNWKAQLTSPVFSTPCGLTDTSILAASSNGKLCIIDSETGVILSDYQLPDETFSSPAVYRTYIFIGCRNDHLFALECISNDEKK